MRKNTVSWQDCKVITKHCCELLQAMMVYQMHTWPPETQGQGHFGGDSSVLVAAITLRDRLDKIIKQSPN